MSEQSQHIIASPVSTPQIAVTQKGAGKLLSLSTMTIRRLEKAGKLKGLKLGGVKLYRVEDLNNLTKN